MRRIVNDLRHHLREDFDPLKYGLIAGFLGLLIFCNYFFKAEKHILSTLNKAGYLVYFSALYALSYYVPVLIKSGRKALAPDFVKTSGVFIGALAMSSGFVVYRDWVDSLPLFEKFYVRNLIANSHGLVWIFVPLAVVWFIDGRKHMDNFYGLSLRHHDFRPYLWLLLLMTPLIALASTQSDFLRSYPTLKVWDYEEVFGLSRGQMMGIYEFFYLTDFIRVEALFRGALVIGLARFIGKDSIIAMATVYCVLHFNKPLGETISSFFGDYLLGTIAYYQKNIVGGCMVHAGIAAMMELAAYLTHSCS